jgi:3-hydroxyisobutyrate dehydrogenase
MGRPMTKNLLKKGHEVIVYDIVASAVEEMLKEGAGAETSPAKLAGRVEVLITILPNAAIVADVITGENGVLAGAEAGLIVVDMSSVGPSDTRKMARAAAQKGVAYMDAPVSGGVPGAVAGRLTIMAGGNKEDFEKVRPVFECLGEKIYHVGEVGSGDAIKIVNNILLGTNMAAAAEALVLGVKVGLKPEIILDIINSSSGQSYALRTRGQNIILTGRFNGGFAIDLQAKDLDLALQLGRENEVPLLMGGLARQIFGLAKAHGFGSQDIGAVIRVLEEATGVEVRGKEELEES